MHKISLGHLVLVMSGGSCSFREISLSLSGYTPGFDLIVGTLTIVSRYSVTSTPPPRLPSMLSTER